MFGVNLTVQDVEQGSADDTRKRADDTAMQVRHGKDVGPEASHVCVQLR